MKVFSSFRRMIRGISSAIRKLIRGEQAAGASTVQKRLKNLRKLGIENSAVKKFGKYQELFKKKHGKDIFSYKLTDSEKAEANEIFNMFLADPSTDEKLIKMKYEGLKDKNLVKDVANVADMAKQIDIVENRAMAKQINDVLGSPIIREIWSAFRGNEDNRYVTLMQDAMLNVANELEDDDSLMMYTSQERIDMVLAEFKRLKEDYEP